MDKLYKVIIFARHSVRMPLYNINNYVKNKLFFLNKGKITKLGKYLMSCSGNYYNEAYSSYGLNTKNIKIYSSKSLRNIQSVKSFLAGYFGNDRLFNKIVCFDDIFNSNITFNSQDEKNEILKKQFDFSIDILEKENYLENEINYLENLIQYYKSKIARINNKEKFDIRNYYYRIENNSLYLNGDIDIASKIADTLIYYHLFNNNFLKELNKDDWKKLSKIIDLHRRLLFGNKDLTTIISNSLINKLSDVCKKGNDIVYFSCHDSNLVSIMNYFGICNYNLEKTSFGEIPPNFDIVFEIYENSESHKYIKAKIMYVKDENYDLKNIKNNNLIFEVFYPKFINENIINNFCINNYGSIS